MPAAEPAPAMKMTLVPTPPPVPAKMPTVRTAGTPSAGAVSLLNTKADPQITEAAVHALTADEIVAPATCTTLLKAAQTHTDVGVRTACIRALARGKAYNPLVLTGLEQLVDDRSVNVRVEAAVALSELKSGK
jgi:HEAT repeat protein